MKKSICFLFLIKIGICSFCFFFLSCEEEFKVDMPDNIALSFEDLSQVVLLLTFFN